MILFIGQVGRGMMDREAFQEIDFRRMFGQMAKWVAQIDDAARIPEYVSRAFHTAVSGRPGPVVLALPEDMLREKAAVPDPQAYQRVEPHPSSSRWRSSERCWLRRSARWRLLAEGDGTRRRQCACAALPKLQACPSQHRSGGRITSTTKAPATWAMSASASIRPLPSASRTRTCCSSLARASAKCQRKAIRCSIFRSPKQQLIHVHASADELGRVYQPDLPINAGPRAFAAALAKTDPVDGSSLARVAGRCAEGLRSLAGCAAHARRAANGRRHRHFAPRPASGCDHRQRRGQYRHLGPSVLPLPAVRDPACADIRVDGLWRPRRHRREAGPSQAHGRRFRRRRLLSDDGTGIRDRDAVQRAGHFHRREQRHVWHDPHAPGADLSQRASAGPISRTRTLPPMRERSAGLALSSQKRKTLRPLSRRPRRPGLPSILELRIDPEAITPRQSLSEIRAAAQRGSA